MGGRGSGGHNRLSDEEKKRRGTFRAAESERVYTARAEQKVITGPWLSSIPEPEYPLNPIGRAKYDELTKELFEQNKLTKITVTQASLAAHLHQKIQSLAEQGKYASANDIAKLQSALRDLKIAENAKVTSGPVRNKFEGSGFANSRTSPIRLRPPSAGQGEL